MRLTPRSIFLALVALGLPFAVTVGWTLGDAPRSTPPAVAAPAGAGGIGAAPEPSKEPVTAVDYGARPARPTASAKPPTSAPATVAPTGSAAPGLPSLSLSPLPPLTDPPVPTPTWVPSAPPSPSPTPSGSAPAPGGFGLIR